MAVNLKATMSMDNRGFVRATDQAKGSVGKLSGALGGMKGMLAAGMFAAAAAGIARIAGSAMKAADDVMNWSARMGVSAKVVQELKIEADEAGIAFKGLMTSFGILARTSQEAAAGNIKYAESFEAMGLRVAELQGMSQEEMFYALSAAVQESGNRVETLGHLFNVLGGQPEKLFNILDALGKRNEEVLSDETVKILDRMNDGWEKTKRTTKNMFSELTAAVGLFSEEIFAGGQGNIFKNVLNLGHSFVNKLTGGDTVELKTITAARERHKANEEAKKKEIEGQAELKRIADEKSAAEKAAEERKKRELKTAQIYEKMDKDSFNRSLKKLPTEQAIQKIKEKIAEAQERANKAAWGGDEQGEAEELQTMMQLQNQIDSMKGKNKLAAFSGSQTPMQSVGALIGRAPLATDLLRAQVGLQTSMDRHLAYLVAEQKAEGIQHMNIYD